MRPNAHLLIYDSKASDTRPFVEGDSSEHFCSIVICTIQTGFSLPVCIPSISFGQHDAHTTIYSVSLMYVYQGRP